MCEIGRKAVSIPLQLSLQEQVIVFVLNLKFLAQVRESNNMIVRMMTN